MCVILYFILLTANIGYMSYLIVLDFSKEKNIILKRLLLILLCNFTTVQFIKPYRDPVHKYTWISVRFYEMGEIYLSKKAILYYALNVDHASVLETK